MTVKDADRPAPDALLVEIADYVTGPTEFSQLAYDTARYCLMDSLGCGLLALTFPECVKRLGPVVPGAELPGRGARVPGTAFELEPVHAAFNIGCMIRWLDFNDTWLAAEWGHPSDNLGAILAVTDYLGRTGGRESTIRDVLAAMIRAHEIQGVLALKNAFNRVGLDHVLLVKVASTAVATRLLGGTKARIVDALSHAWVDGQSLRTYRHAPNTGPRKSWAAGDATSRAVRLALLAMNGETGVPTALSAVRWGFSDVLFGGNPVLRERPFGSYVMENVLFKIAFPAEFHAQTAVEAAITLHPLVKQRGVDSIAKIRVWTQEAAMRIIDKRGALDNPADRDHCLQYMIAVGLLLGELRAEHYEDAFHDSHPEIDALRAKMVVEEEPRYTPDYLDPEKRSIANALQIEFADESASPRVEVEYPLGHRRRRSEGIPLLVEKFRSNLATRFEPARCEQIMSLCADADRLNRTTVNEFMAMLTSPSGVSPSSSALRSANRR
jgi:2-methylcitrate dehydratase